MYSVDQLAERLLKEHEDRVSFTSIGTGSWDLGCRRGL
jgi:hypothetical protein